MSNGVIYSAVGSKYIKMANESVASLKKVCPKIQAKIITDDSELIRGFDIVEIVKKGNHNRYAKLSCGVSSPFDKTLYLDVDTIIVGDISPVFLFLDKYDLAVCLSQKSRMMFYDNSLLRSAGLTQNHSQFAGGVFAFSKRICPEFFNKWLANFKRFENKCQYDQFSLSYTIHTTDVRLYPLPSCWNVRPVWGDSVYGDVKIFHTPNMHNDYSLVQYVKNQKEFSSSKRSPRWVKNK